MAYKITFIKSVSVADPSIYFNDCCWGGDIIRDELLPLVSNQYEEVLSNQEDWGWFIWFRRGPIRFTIDVFCDEPRTSKFRLLLTSQKKKWLIFDSPVDGPELEHLKDVVRQHLASRVEGMHIERIS